MAFPDPKSQKVIAFPDGESNPDLHGAVFILTFSRLTSFDVTPLTAWHTKPLYYREHSFVAGVTAGVESG